MNFNTQMSGEEGAGNGRFFMFVGAFLAIMLVAGGSYFVWNKYFSPEAVTQRNYQKYLDWQANYEKAMKEDTYGGKTPQETMDMFIAALRAGDVELASKYFMLDEGGSRQEWVDYLTDLKNKNFMAKLASDIEQYAQPGEVFIDNAGFVLLNDDGTVGLQIDMKLNTFSKKWKIESL